MHSGLEFSNKDCVVRAITIALNQPYLKTKRQFTIYLNRLRRGKDEIVKKYPYLIQEAKDSDPENKGVYPDVWIPFLQRKGYKLYRFYDKNHKVKELSSKGTYVIGLYGHTTVVKDGINYDIGDCRNLIMDFLLAKKGD